METMRFNNHSGNKDKNSKELGKNEIAEKYCDKLTNKLVEQSNLSKEVIEKIKIIQFAPCGMFEGENITGLIDSFVKQEILPEEKMLVIFVNGKRDDLDTVSKIIDDRKSKNTNENIVCLKHRWSRDDVFSMGMIRAIPVDFLKKIYKKHNVYTDPLIVSNDADTVSLSKNYLKNYIIKLPENNFGGGISRFHFSGINFLYDLNLGLGDIDRMMRNFGLEKDSFNRDSISQPGSNTAFRLNDYPGYTLGKNKGEDTDFSKKLAENGVKFKCINNSKVYTDPRRIINSFNRGRYFHEAWKDWKDDGDKGRELDAIEKKDYTVGEVNTFINGFLNNKLCYLFEQNHHRGNYENFIAYSNSYVNKMIKYLKVFLRAAAIDIPGYQFSEIEYIESETASYLLDRLKNHAFVLPIISESYKDAS